MANESLSSSRRQFNEHSAPNASKGFPAHKNLHNICLQTGEEFSTEFLHDRITPRKSAFTPKRLDFSFNQNPHHVYEDLNSILGLSRNDSEKNTDQTTAIPNPYGDISFLENLKLLCSFGGKILPRPGDGKLRYVGGETRIISIRKNLRYKELVKRTYGIFSSPHIIKYQLPGEDLDALISLSSDEDIHNMIEEYHHELERLDGSKRLRLFLVSFGESDDPSFESMVGQQHDVDYQYVAAVNGTLDPSPRKSSSGQSMGSQLGSSTMDYSPGFHRESPSYFQALDFKPNEMISPSYMDNSFANFPLMYYPSKFNQMKNKDFVRYAESEIEFERPMIKERESNSNKFSSHPEHEMAVVDSDESHKRMIHALSDSKLQEQGEKREFCLDERKISLSLMSSEMETSIQMKYYGNYQIYKDENYYEKNLGSGDEMLNWIGGTHLGGKEKHHEENTNSPNTKVSVLSLNLHKRDNNTTNYFNKEDEKVEPWGRFKERSEFGDDFFGKSTTPNILDEKFRMAPVIIVEDVTDYFPAEIPSSSKVVPLVENDVSDGNLSDRETDEESVTLQSDCEDSINNSSGINESISDAAIAEIEAGIYGLQIIKNDDLEELRELGSGTFGTVYHGKWRGTDVAIKRIKKSCFAGRSSEQERLTKDFWREAQILSNLHHPNVVAFYGVVPDGPGGTLATVTEFMVNGSLRHVLQKKERVLDRRKRLLIAMDAAFGMEYLHMKNIVHFDLKCENLLVNMRDPQRPICKVGDFGLSRIKRNTLVSGGVRGTLPWMAPELLNGSSNRVSEKVDVFSFGVAMWEILTGEEPYAKMHCGAIIGGIVNNTLRPPIPNRCNPEWRKLMEECWSHDPVARPSFTEITKRLRHMSMAFQIKRAH